MKKFFLFIVLITISNSAFTQNDLSSEEQFRRYFKNKISDLDPLEGIWNFTTRLSSKINTNDFQEHSNKVAIYKAGNCFYQKDFQGNASTCDFSNTADETTYIVNSSNTAFTISNNAFRYTEEGPEERLFVANTFVKLYPSKNEIIVAQKEVANNVKSTGTGFLINQKGYIVTNYHVINMARSIKVKGVQGDFNKSYDAKIAMVDKNNDLAIIKIEALTKSIPYRLSRIGTSRQKLK